MQVFELLELVITVALLWLAYSLIVKIVTTLRSEKPSKKEK